MVNCTGSDCGQTFPNNESYESILRKENDIKAELYMPVILYIVVLLVTGVIGNSLVIYVYLKRFKRTSSNYFIMSMAMFDMVACCIGMPTEIYDLRYPLMFDNIVACKLFRFSESVPVIGSAFILVAVAFDRYFKICKPFKNTPLQFVKRVCIGIAVFAFFTTIPTIFVFGVKDVDTSNTFVKGKDCSILKTSSGKTSILSRIWFIYLSVVFVVCTLTMFGLYLRIWVEIKRRRNQVIGSAYRKPSNGDSGLPKSPTSPTYKTPQSPEIPKEPVTRVKYLPSQSISSDPDSGGLSYPDKPGGTLGRLGSNSSEGMDPEKKSLRQVGENVITKIKASKTTVILFTVTMAFILSYLPTLVVTVIKNKDGSHRTDSVDFMMKLFSKSYFINNSINPIIYSFLNVNFRMECARTLSKLFSWCLCGLKSDSGSAKIRNPNGI